jgi:hypothetical protein
LRVLVGQEDMLGVSSPDTLVTAEFLVTIYKKLHRSGHARMLEQRILS